MDTKSKEKGILKLEPRPRLVINGKRDLTPQGSYDRLPASPQPSVDRLSVTWADPNSMTSSGVNLFPLPSETPVPSEVKFSSSAGEVNYCWLDVSEDEDYSASLNAVLYQRRASVRRSRKGRTRRPSSPFLPDENRSRRRSSVFTTSSGDTAISIDDTPVVAQEKIFENIHLHKEVLGSVKQQPLGMRRKLKIVHQAKGYIKRHEGQLQERLAQSKSTKDIYARFNILIATKWQHLKREAANTSNLLIPWELRIKEIESHFGSVVASYFTFLRWLFWVNLVIGSILLVFVIVPEYLTADPLQDGVRKIIMEEERRNSTKLLILWEFEGVLKCSPIFYGYYTNVERPEYRMPLAYFLTGLVVYIYSFVAILRKMAENSRMSKLSEKEDECVFSWKLFTGWDFMIGNTETAHNRIASVILGFKEALLEEAEKKKDIRNWRIIALRALVNICVAFLLVVSAFAVVTVVSRSDDNSKSQNWWRENETTTVVTVISITFPVFFELLGFLEHYHPRKQLRLQLARIMLLNLLNLYSLIFALFNKIEGMSKDLDSLQPTLKMNASVIIPENTLDMSMSLMKPVLNTCYESEIPCLPCYLVNSKQKISASSMNKLNTAKETQILTPIFSPTLQIKPTKWVTSDTLDRSEPPAQNLIQINDTYNVVSTPNIILEAINELKRLRNISDLSKTLDFEQNNGILGVHNDSNDNEDYHTTIFDIETTNNLVTNNISVIDFMDYYGTETNNNSENNFEFEPNNLTTSFNSINDNLTHNLYLSTLNIFNSTRDSTYANEIYKYETESEIALVTSGGITTSFSSEITDNYYNKDYDDVTSSPLVTYSSESSTVEWKDTSTIINSNDTKLTTTKAINELTLCPNISFNFSLACGKNNITQEFFIINCTVSVIKCYMRKCELVNDLYQDVYKNITFTDVAYIDEENRKMYNLTKETQKKLLKLCWETMFGQELIKLTMMDLVFVLLGTLFMDFFRALFVRNMNRCWCWDLEKKFPEYGDFKIAENILHLINNQGMVWMGMFFSPGLVVLNVFKLMIMMYLRSWAVMTCNVPHEVVFRVSKSNNFYLALLLTMLFLCVLPVGYTIVWVKPSWHCGPFSEYEKIYHILTNKIYKLLPRSLNFALEYIASPAIVIPLLVLLILIIYYLTSLTNSLREANNDLKIQLRRERTEERRKMFQLADTRRRTGSTAIDSTPFSRWKKALPSLPKSKSVDSEDRTTTLMDERNEHTKREVIGGLFSKIVGFALDKKPAIEIVTSVSQSSYQATDETDIDIDLPKEILKTKGINKYGDSWKKPNVDFKTEDISFIKRKSEKKVVLEKLKEDEIVEEDNVKAQFKILEKEFDTHNVVYCPGTFQESKKQTSDSSSQSKQSDSISSVIPVITISTTESDDELLNSVKIIEQEKDESKVIVFESKETKNKVKTSSST